ncbi:MAG TPA: tape measure protein, partial [Acinetobacter sp.]|nr:tape measure protein [Acinetobacter sp.]
KDMGKSQQFALEMTSTVTKAIQLGGSSTQEAEGAVTQFIQAMQGGVLRGEEFNSIMEGGYGLAEALAKGLGVTTGELRKMAEAGELSAERVLTALEKQKAGVDAQYAEMPLTISNALQKIATSWQILIGEMDQANGASATVAQWLSTLADNMGLLKPIIDDIGNGFTWISDKLQSIDSSTVDALYQALKTAYDGLKSLISMLGNNFSATTDILNTALSQVFSFASGIDSTEDSTNGFTKALQAINVALGFLSDGFTAIGIGVNALVGAFYTVSAAFEQVKATFTWGDVREKALANMQAMQEKAQEYYQKASDGALNFKSKGVEALNEIGKTQAERDQEAVASSKAKLDSLLADQNTEKEGRKVTEAEKLAAVQKYAELSIKANGGVIDGTMQADLMTKGYIVTLDQTGKVAVSAWDAAATGANKTSN